MLPNLPSKEIENFVSPTSLTYTHLCNANNDPGKQMGEPPAFNVPLDVIEEEFTGNESETTFHPHELTSKISSSNPGLVSINWDSSSEDFESCIEVKETQYASSAGTQESSKMVDSKNEIQRWISSQSKPLI